MKRRRGAWALWPSALFLASDAACFVREPAILRKVSGPVVDVISVIALIGSIVGVVWLVWIASRGDREREAEDEAREYFSAHGRWPDDD
jgi:hypothetical protein